MATVGFVLGVLLFAVGIGASIGLHEIGHLVPAKRFGVRVPQYMIGFGKTLWSTRRGDTEYGVKAVPLGGYIRMIGMYPPPAGTGPDGAGPAAEPTGRFGQLAEEARKASQEELQPGDDNRVFYKLSVPKKLTIMLGGPVMNLVLATVMLALLVTVHGVPTIGKGALVSEVSACVLPTTAADTTTCPAGATPAPAAAAGLKAGDRLVSIAGRPVVSTEDVGTLIRPRAGQATPVVILRDGHELTLTVTPVRNVIGLVDAAGKPVLAADGKQKTTQAGFLGIMSGPVVGYATQPLTVVPGLIGSTLGAMASAIIHLPQGLGNVWTSTFDGQKRDPNGIQSVVGVGRVAGDVASGRVGNIMGMPVNSASDRGWFLVQILAMLNLMLFVFNMVPLMPFDGGQMAGALWEGVKRGWYRLQGRTGPAYVDVAKALPITYAVSVLLIAMTLLLVYADLVNPIKLGG